MIEPGKKHTLKITQQTDFGWFLDAQDYGLILLHKSQLKTSAEIGQTVDVFLYFDADRQLTATLEQPIAQVGQWGMMKVVEVNNVGAFVDWGIAQKSLLVPFGEQRTRLQAGQKILVYVYRDKASGRLVGTTKFNRLLDKTPADYQQNEAVDLLIAEHSALGMKAIINAQHWGMIFHSDVIGQPKIGQQMTGYIKSIREDGKIDLSLQKVGVEKMTDLAQIILQRLQQKDGFLPLHDKSTPQAIFSEFQTSKGTFKKALGQLYKQGCVVLQPDGIQLKK